MALTTKTEPVLLANLVPAILTALVAVATAFDWWDPTEEQIGALAGIAAALIAAATAFARSKAYAPSTVDQIKVEEAENVLSALDQRNEANKLAQGALAVAAQAQGRPVMPPTPSQPAAFADTAFHPTAGPVGGRSGPGTPGNT